MHFSWVNQLFRLGRGFNSELFVYQRVNDVNYGRFTGAKRREWRNGMIMNIYYGSFPHSLQPVRKYWKKWRNHKIVFKLCGYRHYSWLVTGETQKKQFSRSLGVWVGTKKKSRKPTNI